VAEPGLV
jgi:hypothetical protein